MKITLSHPHSMEALARMAGGVLHPRATEPVTLTHICTDSREADGDTLFCAIRGERVDGHSFIPALVGGGCCAFLCERLPDGWETMPPAVAIVVPDTVEALSRLSLSRREEELAELAVVAITGSVGKTTTKEMTAAVLSQAKGSLFKKDGNYNSTVGLPLSFLEIPTDTATAVLEMGMSARGEISTMTGAVRPNIAVISNIGTSHMEHLGSRENIARAKLEIAEGLSEGGVLLINGDEPLLVHLGQDFEGEKPCIPAGIRVLRVSLAGTPRADYTARRIQATEGGMTFDLDTPEGCFQSLFVPAMGEHLVLAGVFAAAVGQLCGMHEAEIRRGLASYRPAAMRQSSRKISGVTLIEDCYNAAPESMRAALSVLDMTAASTQGRRIAVLGDMKELGKDSQSLHRAVGADLARRGVELLITVGELGAEIAQGALDAGMKPAAVRIMGGEDTYPATAACLARVLREGDAVLFKASRAMALERLSGAVADELTARA